MFRKLNVITVRLDNNLDKDLNRLVERQNMSKSKLIRELIKGEGNWGTLGNRWNGQSFDFDR